MYVRYPGSDKRDLPGTELIKRLRYMQNCGYFGQRTIGFKRIYKICIVPLMQAPWSVGLAVGIIHRVVELGCRAVMTNFRFRKILLYAKHLL